MKTFSILGLIGLLSMEASADTLVLKDGTSIDWRVLKDSGDSLEVQTFDNRTLTVAKKDVKEIKVTVVKAPLTGATFTGDLTKGGAPLNVLQAIDPKKHASGGDARISGGVLVCSGSGILEVPHVPPNSYDVEMVIERKEGEEECHIGLVASGKPFSIQIDWSKGTCTGLSGVDGKRVYENETRTNGKLLMLRKPRTILCAVREDVIVVLIDGKEFIRWKGDPKRLSLSSRPEKDQNLFFSWNSATFWVSKYVVTPRN
jgi:hypothetical protein